MIVIVDVDKFYDWEKLPPGVEPTEDDHTAGRVMAANDHTPEKPSWNARVERAKPSQVTFAIGDHTWDAYARSNKYGGMTRNQHIAMYLAEHASKEAHQDHWRRITVEGEPELESFLNNYFECDGGEKS